LRHFQAGITCLSGVIFQAQCAYLRFHRENTFKEKAPNLETDKREGLEGAMQAIEQAN